MSIVYAMAAGFLLDCIVGDPHGLPHPVRWIGRLISLLDGWLNRKQDTRERNILSGAIYVAVVLAVTGTAVFFFRLFLYRLSGAAGVLGDGLLFYYCIAPRSLCRESMAVYRELLEERKSSGGCGADGLGKARRALSMIVGRDTEHLTEEGVIRAAVETVAENTSDGVTAPMFYMALGGPLLCFLYKAVNTMDSMTGYHNETYEYFGKAAAVMDDIWNYIPSRLTAFVMLFATMVLSPFYPYLDWKRGFMIYRRDRRKHKSPNAAQTESVCAGALGIRLAGAASYFGKTVQKPWIGDENRPIEREDIRRANGLMYASSFLTLFLLAGMRFLWGYMTGK